MWNGQYPAQYPQFPRSPYQQPPTPPPPQQYPYPSPNGPPPPPPPPYQGYQQPYYPPPAGPPSQAYFPSPDGPPPPPVHPPQTQRYAPPPMPPTQIQHYGPTVQSAPGDQQAFQPYFQWSQCTGRKRALCIGINYVGQANELAGCINDARNMEKFLCTHFGYPPGDIVCLADDSSNPRQVPTRQNILEAMFWLVQGAQPNDSLFFHFSGHGGQTQDVDGDEADGFDEVIYPLDHEQRGFIVDDEMHDILVKSLPAGCRLTAIFDCCHSGSALDLPYMYSTEGKIKEPNVAAEAGQGILSAAMSYARGDLGSVFSSVSGVLKTATGQKQKIEDFARRTKTTPADVISWSGCKDVQTSADTVEAGQATGAMSYAFIKVLSENKYQSYQQLLVTIREVLRNKYSQKPQLSSSHPIDTNVMFIC